MNMTPANATVVYVFPGLGANYPGMLEKFCAYYPWANALVKEWETLVDFPFSENHQEDSKTAELAKQFQIHALNLLWWRNIKQPAGKKIVCCGHSLGFYAALVAAGGLSADDSWFWLKTIFNYAWDEFCHQPCNIEVLTTTIGIDAHRLAKQFCVEVLARNSKQQIVIHGDPSNIAELGATLEWTKLRCSNLGSIIPFHSAKMFNVCDKLLKMGESYQHTFKAPQHEVWSHITAEPLISPDSLYLTLVQQPKQTVNWQSLIENLSTRYQPEFVEVGPNRVLSQIIKWTEPHLVINYVDHIRKSVSKAPITGETI